MYLYNVWVNWRKQDKMTPTILEYYEWRSTDNIEKIDKIPIVYVTNALYSYLNQCHVTLPKKIAKEIKNRTSKSSDNTLLSYPYVCIIANKHAALAIQWDEENKEWYKSKLIPKQEKFVLRSKIQKQRFRLPFLCTLQPKRNYVRIDGLGLTRYEKEKRLILMGIIGRMEESATEAELLYWLKEWDYSNNQKTKKKMSKQFIWKELYHQICEGWDKKHDRFFEKITAYTTYRNFSNHTDLYILYKLDEKKHDMSFRSTK